jgi:hypothetical protein
MKETKLNSLKEIYIVNELKKYQLKIKLILIYVQR